MTTVAVTGIEGGANAAANFVNITEESDGITLVGTTDLTGAAGEEISVTIGVNTYVATLDGLGGWTLVIPAGVMTTQGLTTLTINATDGTTPASATATFTLDTVAPAAATFAFTDGDGFVSGAELSAASYTITGLESGGTADITLTQGGTVQTVNVTADGTLDLGALGFTEGTVTATVNTFDAALNNTTGNGDVTVIDTDADLGDDAAVTIEAGAAFLSSASDLSAVAFTVSGLDSDATATVTFTGVDSLGAPISTIVTGNSVTLPATVDLTGFADGAVTATLDIVDVRANIATGASDTITIDTNADVDGDLAVSFDDLLINAGESAGITVNLVGLDADTSGTLTISSDGSGAGAGAASVTAIPVPAGASSVSGIDISSLADGNLTVSFAGTDTAGNSASASSNSAVLDATAPTVLSAELNIDLVNEAEAGGMVTVTVTFDSPMINDGSMNPSIAFSPLVNGTLDAIVGSEGWNAAGTVYSVDYAVTDIDVTTADIDITVTGGADLAGNMHTTTTTTADFDIDMAAPTVTGIVFGDVELNEADAGAAGATFTVEVSYSEAMDNATTPSITFSQTIAGLSLTGGVWSNSDTVYTATYALSDANDTALDVTVDVDGASDAQGNPQDSFVGANTFTIDTTAPADVSGTVTIDEYAEPNDAALAGQVLFSGLPGSDAGGAITYSFGASGDLGGAVAIGPDGIGGFNVTVADPTYFDFEDNPVITLDIVATDAVGNTSDSVMTVNLNDLNDNPEYDLGASSIAGVIAERADTNDAAENASLGFEASGSLFFTDDEITDTHSVSVTNLTSTEGSFVGLFVAGLADPAAGDGNGRIDWTFDQMSAAQMDTVDALAVNESIVQTYRIDVIDSDAAVTSQVVTITITGTNDAPLIEAATDGDGAVTELVDGSTMPAELTSNLSDGGTITFSDVDVTDTHMASVQPVVTDGVTAIASPLGALTLGAVDQSTNTVDWTFTVSDGAVDYLRDGDTVTQVYTVIIDDQSGAANATVEQTVEITITGTNDLPVISSVNNPASATAETANGTAPQAISTQGTLDVADVDIGDTIAGDNTADATAMLNGMDISTDGRVTALIADANLTFGADLTATGASQSLSFSYDVAAADLDFLRAGDTLTLTYSVFLNDGIGNSTPQDLTITITGTNDAPIIDSVAQPAGITEVAGDSSAQDLMTTGTLDVSDLDHGDTLTGSVVGTASADLDGTDISGDARVSALIANGALTFDASATSDGTAQTLAFTYDVTGADIDFLREGEELTLTYTVDVGDGSATSNSATVDIVITGSNDAPVISNVVNPAQAVEGAGDNSAQAISVNGTFDVTDADHGDTVTAEIVTDMDGTALSATAELDGTDVTGNPEIADLIVATNLSIGSSVTSDGTAQSLSFGYQATADLDFLQAGETLTLTYLVRLDDGQSQSSPMPVEITIMGTNDQPTISAGQINATILVESGVTAPGISVTSGTVAALWNDLDATQTADLMVIEGSSGIDSQAALTFDGSATGAMSGEAAISGTYGSLYISQDGSYRYVLDDDLPATQALTGGQSVSEQFNYTIGNTGSDTTIDSEDVASSTITINITGANDAPVITASGTDIADSVAEAAETAAMDPTLDAGTLQTDGNLSFADVDAGNTFTAAVDGVVPSGTLAGLDGAVDLSALMTLTTSTPTTTTGVDWDFSSAETVFDYLADGESITLTYTISVTDNEGGVDTQEVAITVTGENDAPVVSVVNFSDDAEGNSLITTNGTGNEIPPQANAADIVSLDLDSVTTIVEVDASDVQWIDTVSVTAGSDAATTGALTATGFAAADLEGLFDISAQDGTITYDRNQLLFDRMDDGESVTVTFTYNVNSGTMGGAFDTETRSVTLTINGANDAPYFTSLPTSLTGDVTEFADGSTATDAVENVDTHVTDGTITFDDLELNDTHTVTIIPVTDTDTPALADYVGNLASGFTQSATGAGDGEIIWTYSVADSVIDNLTEGETITQRYQVSITDGTDSVIEDIVITITGTNDAPVIEGTNPSHDVDEALTEQAGLTGDATVLNAGGTIAFSDVDISSLVAGTQPADTFTVSEAFVSAVHTNGGAVVDTNTTTPIGLFTTGVIVDDLLDAEQHSVDWDFNAADNGFDYLAAGDTLVVTYAVTITDDSGAANAAVTQNVTLTITGTNDAPTITSAYSDPVDLVEVGLGLTPVNEVSGDISGDWVDVDFGEQALLAVTEGSADGAAQTALTFDGAATGAMGSEAAITGTYGTLYINTDGTYRYVLDDADVDTQGLNLGDEVNDIFNYTIANGPNADDAVSSTLTVTIQGDNDAPEISVTGGAEAGSVTEAGVDGSNAAISGTPTDTGTLSVSDVDSADDATTDTWSIIAATGQTQTDSVTVVGEYGTLTIDQNGTWTYTLDQAAADALDGGDMPMETFTVNVSDNDLSAEGTDTQTVTITVNGTNDAPTVTGSLASTAAEGAAAYNFDLLTNSADIDADDAGNLSVANVTGLTAGVTLNGNSVDIDPTDSAFDSLGVGDSAVITVSYDIVDGNGGSVAQTAQITITGTNDAPVAEDFVVTGPINEDAGFSGTFGTTIPFAAVASDVDGPLTPASFTFDSVTVAGVAAADLATAGITYDSVSGAFTFNGGAAIYQDLDQGDSINVIVTFTVTDDQSATDQGTVTFNVIGQNDAPVLAGVLTESVSEGASASINMLMGATDIDADDANTLAIANLGALPAGVTFDGTSGLTIDADDAAYQSLAAGSTATAVVNFDVTDGTVNVAQTATFTITGTNDQPTIANAEINGTTLIEASSTVAGTASVSGDVSVDWADLDAGETADLMVTQGSHDANAQAALVFDGSGAGAMAGEATISGTYGSLYISADGTYRYELDNSLQTTQGLTAGQAASETFNYTIANTGADHAIDADDMAMSTITVNITGTNDLPVVTPLADTTDDNAGTFSFDLLTNASDVDAGTVLSITTLDSTVTSTGDLALTLTDGVDYSLTGSTLTLSDLSVFDMLDDGDSAQLVFNFNVDDGNGGVVANSLTLTVNGINDAPIANDDAASVNEGAFALFNVVFGGSTGMVVDTDPDGDTLVLVSGGDLADAASGEALGGSAAVTSAVPGSFFTDWGAEVTLQSNGLINYNLTSSSAAFNTLAAGVTAVDTFEYTISDGDLTSTATVSVTITGTNDPITANADSITATENVAVPAANLTDNDTDVDTGPTATKTITGVTAGTGVVSVTPVTGGFNVVLASGVMVMVNSDGTYAVTAPDSLNQGETVTGEFVYTVQDDGGAQSSATVSVSVDGVNDGPTVAAALTETAAEDAALFTVDLLDGADDADSASVLTVTGVTGLVAGLTVSGSTLSVDPADASFQSLSDTDSVTITVSYTIEDQFGASVPQTADITITGTNDLPEVAAALSAPATEDGASVSIAMLTGASDVDAGTTLVIDSVGSLPAGVTYDAGLATLTLDPIDAAYQSLALGEPLAVTVNYVIGDGDGGTVNQTATFNLTGTNDVPTVAAALTAAANEDDASFTVDLLDGAADVDNGAVLSVANLSVLPAGLTVSGSTLTVDPMDASFQALALGEPMVMTVTYDVVDEHGASVAQTATVTITGTNDVPTVAAALTAAANEDDASFTVDLLDGASDVDNGAVLSVANLSALPAGLTVSGSTLTVDPMDASFQALALGEPMVMTVTYDVVDELGASVAQSATVTITGTNDTPTVAAALAAAANEDDSSFTVDLLGGASDVDNGAVLSVANLSTLPAGLTVSGSTLTVDPMDASFQALALGEPMVMTVTYDVVDEHGASVAQSATVTITGTNDVPTVAAALTELATEDGASASISMLDGAADVDNGAVLSVANVGALPAGVTYDGVSTLTLDPSDAAYQSLAMGETTTVTVMYDVSDELGATVAQTASFTITGTNDVPTVAAALTAAANEDDASFTVDLLGGASDVDNGAVLSVANLSTLPAGLTVSGSTLTVDPADANFQALALGEPMVMTVTYDVVDELGASVSQTATVTITGTNDTPTVAAALTAAAAEDDASFTVDLLDGASDVDNGAVLSVANLSTLPAGLTVSGSTLTVDPADASFQALALGEPMVMTVTYDVVDELGASVSQTATVTITGTNDTPSVAAALTAGAAEDDASFTVDLLDGASDVDNGAVLSVANLSALPAGLTVSGSTLTVDPMDASFQALALGEPMVMTVTYDVVDEHGASVAQTATVTITGTNDVPTVAAALTAAANEDDASFTVDLLDGASDVDNGAVLSVANLSALPAGLTVSGSTLTVDPMDASFQALALGEPMVMTVTYDVVDEHGASVAQSATVTITGTNDTPIVAAALTAAAAEDDASFTVDLLDGASDVDNGAVLSVANVTGLTAGVMLSGSTLSVDPADAAFQSLAQGETQTITVFYDVVDEHGASAAQTATVTITGANDAPVVAAALTAAANEDDAGFTVNLLGGASDADNGAVLSVANVTGLVPGVTLSGSTLSVDPTDAAFQSLEQGVDQVITVSYDVVDQFGASVAQTTIVTITGTNDAPTVSGALTQILTEGLAPNSIIVLQGAGDVDFNFSLTATNFSPLPASVTFDGTSLILDPSNGDYEYLAQGETVDVVITYDIIDGLGGSVTQTATFTVIGTNDAPVVSAAVAAAFSEDDGITNVDLLANASDVDTGATLSVGNLTLVSGDNSGVALVGNSLVVDNSAYDSLAAGESAVITYSYDVLDELGSATPTTVTVTINGANDAPIVNAIVGAADEDGPAVTLTADFTDADLSDGASFSIDVSGTLGLVTDNGDGTFTYDPNGAFENLDAGATTTDSFTYTVDDGNGGVVTNTATVTITGADDAPVVSGAFTGAAVEGDIGDAPNIVFGSVAISDVDDGDVPVFADVSGLGDNAYGTFDLAAGVWTYTVDEAAVQDLDAGDVVSDTFVFTASDGTMQSVSVDITGTDDASVVTVVDNGSLTEDDISVSGVLTIADVDGDDMPEFTALAAAPSDNGYGTFDLDASGWTFVLDQSTVQNLSTGDSVTDSITFTATDGTVQSVTVTITGANEIIVGDGDDNVLTGTAFVDEISGLGGDDILIGDASDDTLDGGDGNDLLDGQGGLDALIGGAGDDTAILYADMLDTFDGGAGEDTINFVNTPTALDIDLTAGTVNGSSVLTSVENVVAGSGVDTIAGSADDNVIEGRGGADILSGGAGTDTVAYTYSGAGVTIELASGFADGGDATGDVISGFENIIGSNFADDLSGSSFDNVIEGGGGADVINGGGGGSNTSSYAGSGAAVTVNLETGVHTGGDAAGDSFINIQNIEGSDFNDRLTGDDDDNVLSGLGGNDRFIGNGGADTIDGGEGFDVVDYFAADTGIRAYLDGRSGVFGDASGDVLISIEQVIGSRMNDLIIGSGADERLDGRGGDDIIRAAQGNDRLLGGNGNDDMDAGGGDDILLGQAGDDVLDGNIGDDRLIGGSGADVLIGGTGRDIAEYSTSSTAVTASLLDASINTGEAAGDTYIAVEDLDGSAFNDTLIGDHEVNRLFGGSGDDMLYGNGGLDRLYGGDGNDVLDGGDVGDFMYGGDGDDILIGGQGNDKLFGNAGADVFVYAAGGDSDTIFDFEDGVDLIDLTAFTLSDVTDALAGARQVGASVRLNFGDGDTITIRNTDLADITMDDFIVSGAMTASAAKSTAKSADNLSAMLETSDSFADLGVAMTSEAPDLGLVKGEEAMDMSVAKALIKADNSNAAPEYVTGDDGILMILTPDDADYG